MLRAGNPNHLICYHGQGSTSSSIWVHKEDWPDFNFIHSEHNFGSDSYTFVNKDYPLTPAKLTVDIEPAYEDLPTGTVLAGATRHGFDLL